MKKVLHISKYYYPFVGGIESTARDCVISLKGLVEQKVVCFNDNVNSKKDIVDDVEVMRCGCFAKIRSQSMSFSLAKKCKELSQQWKPDYVLIHLPNPYGVRQVLKYFSNTNVIVYWHSDIVKQKVLGKLFYGQNMRLLSLAYRIIATSPNYIEGSIFLNTVKEKCVVIPSCVNENRLGWNKENMMIAKKIRESTPNKIICFAFGRHVTYKGFKYLIEASRYLDDRFIIYIAGVGELTKELKTFAAGDDKIIFLGKISDEELKNYLLATDIFCFPSITRNEAFGLALAESMFYGKPTVTFTIPGSGVNYVCRDGKEGIEVENSNGKKYAEAIIKLGDDKKLRDEYGASALKRAEELFLFDKYSVKIKELI